MKKRLLMLLLGSLCVAFLAAGCKGNPAIEEEILAQVGENTYIAQTEEGTVFVGFDEEGNPVGMMDEKGNILAIDGASVEKDEKGKIVSVTTKEGNVVTIKEKVVREEAQAPSEEKEEAEAIEAIKKYTEEDLGRVTLGTIFGGDILQSKFFLSLVLWFIMVAMLMLVYTYNRYQSQQDIITIDNLKTELQEVKYNVLTQSSELMNLSRQSNVEKYLKATNDSMLKNPTTPPYLIRTVEANP